MTLPDIASLLNEPAGPTTGGPYDGRGQPEGVGDVASSDLWRSSPFLCGPAKPLQPTAWRRPVV